VLSIKILMPFSILLGQRFWAQAAAAQYSTADICSALWPTMLHDPVIPDDKIT